jgi:hypothetical protein
MCKQVNAVGFKYPFDIETFKKLKTAYKNAKLMEVKSFSFLGRDILVDYAKYLVEYLESRFKSE